MKRLLALVLACVMLAGCMSAACAQEYTLAEKLYRQLLAGSGFSAVVTLEADTERFDTLKPIVLDLDYLFDRPQEEISLGQHCLDLSMMDGETVLSQAHARAVNGEIAFQADVIGSDWYWLRAAGEQAEAMPQSSAATTAAAILSALQITKGMDKQVDAALKDALESFVTRIDIWIEGYRQSAILDKLEDGTTTMQVDYAIPESAVKSQLKQMLYELLNDAETLSALRLALGEDMGIYLNPLLQNWYFDCIDALQLQHPLTISRVFSLKGETLSLQLNLPMYTSELGSVLLTYARTSGEQNDLPDEHVVGLESDAQNLSLTWQAYSSMTGVEVMQGSLDGEGGWQGSVAFTLKQEIAESRDANDRDVYDYSASLALTPQMDEANDEIEIMLAARFASETRKSAATDISATLTVSSADEAIELTLQGASRKNWEPAAVPAPVDGDWQGLLPGAALRTMAVLADYVKLPETVDVTE